MDARTTGTGRGVTVASGARAGRGYALRTALGTNSWTCQDRPAVGAEAHPIVSYTHPPMGLGTAIIVAAVLAGGAIGTLAGQRLPEGMRSTAMQAIGLVTLLIGVQNFLVFGRAPTQIVPTLTSVKVR